MWTFVWFVTTFLGGHDGLEPTDRLVPRGYQGNPWGPEANQSRLTGAMPPVIETLEMKQWRLWGKATLREGDILFRRGDARLLFGYFPFSRFLANVTGSRFSHTGQAAIEDGEPFVYDMTKAGVRRQPFSVWILDNKGPFAVKRIRPERIDVAHKAVEFCRDVYQKQVPFDYDLNLDDTSYYCVELTEKSYRAGGMALSEPVLIGDMENAAEFPICIYAFSKLSPLRLDQAVFFPGNERHGIWSCPLLETVYESPKDEVVNVTTGH